MKGIESRIDYLAEIGVEAVWISPFFTSPMIDFGYDISNFTDVDPIFGTMDDFKSLLNLAHERDLKIVLDFVPNHSRGAFNNYVDRILPFFDPPPPCMDSFYSLNVHKNRHF